MFHTDGIIFNPIDNGIETDAQDVKDLMNMFKWEPNWLTNVEGEGRRGYWVGVSFIGV